LEEKICQWIGRADARQFKRVAVLQHQIALDLDCFFVIAGGGPGNLFSQSRNARIQCWQLQVIERHARSRTSRSIAKTLARPAGDVGVRFVTAYRMSKIEIV